MLDHGVGHYSYLKTENVWEFNFCTIHQDKGRIVCWSPCHNFCFLQAVRNYHSAWLCWSVQKLKIIRRSFCGKSTLYLWPYLRYVSTFLVTSYASYLILYSPFWILSIVVGASKLRWDAWDVLRIEVVRLSRNIKTTWETLQLNFVPVMGRFNRSFWQLDLTVSDCFNTL